MNNIDSGHLKNPQVWHRFEKVNKKGETIKFKVQELTEEYYDDVFELLTKKYLKEEPWVANTKIADEFDSLEVYVNFFKNFVVPQNVSIICIEDNDRTIKQKIAGFNFLRITLKNKGEDFSEFAKSQNTKTYLMMYKLFLEYCPNIFEKYNTDTYLGSNGFFVSSEYRDMNVGTEILKARKPLCEALGIKITTSKFTITASQKCAIKAGFEEDASISYDLFRKATGYEFKNCEDCKLMTLRIE